MENNRVIKLSGPSRRIERGFLGDLYDVVKTHPKNVELDKIDQLTVKKLATRLGISKQTLDTGPKCWFKRYPQKKNGHLAHDKIRSYVKKLFEFVGGIEGNIEAFEKIFSNYYGHDDKGLPLSLFNSSLVIHSEIIDVEQSDAVRLLITSLPVSYLVLLANKEKEYQFVKSIYETQPTNSEKLSIDLLKILNNNFDFLYLSVAVLLKNLYKKIQFTKGNKITPSPIFRHSPFFFEEPKYLELKHQIETLNSQFQKQTYEALRLDSARNFSKVNSAIREYLENHQLSVEKFETISLKQEKYRLHEIGLFYNLGISNIDSNKAIHSLNSDTKGQIKSHIDQPGSVVLVEISDKTTKIETANLSIFT